MSTRYVKHDLYTRQPPCKPSIEWRLNGRLFAVCGICPYMRGNESIYWPTGAPWPCKAKELPGD